MNIRLPPICQVVDVLLILLVCSVGVVKVEEKLLTDDYVQMTEFVKMKTIVMQLEAAVTRLEAKIEDQALMISNLYSRCPATVKLAEDVVETDNILEEKSIIPRTCRDANANNPSLSSGMYWIDPDGPNVGDDAIYVFCNMTSGSTFISHDSEFPVNVGHCTDPGCYTRIINYDASIGQIFALAKLSHECHQTIRYDCYFAPFEFNSVPYSWWNNRHGNSQYFWDGSGANAHICRCGIDRNCIDPSLMCNCDKAAPEQLYDIGVITDKEILPIIRLNFGRTYVNSSSGVHTLGKFECTGQVAVKKIPSSCEDLWRIGHTLNGLYSIMGVLMVESVYCDFTKLPDEPDFQKWIGYLDIQSAPTYFYVQKNTSKTTVGTIPFEVARLNVGNAMDLASGIFKATRVGTYFFSFVGHANFPTSDSPAKSFSLGVSLYMNGNRIGSAVVEDSTDYIYHQNSPLSLQSTISLKSGDEIWVSIDHLSSGILSNVYLDDNPYGYPYTHFTGWMLQEDIHF